MQNIKTERTLKCADRARTLSARYAQQVECEIMPHDIREEETRRKFYDLVHREFGGDLRDVEVALSNHPSRKVTRRTIQSWLIKGSAASRRKCPEWALTLLEEYVSEHPDRLERIRARAENERAFNHTKGVGSSFADRADREGVRMAESHTREITELTDKLAKAPLTKLPEAFANELYAERRKRESIELLVQAIISVINEADETTTVLDLKKALRSEQQLLFHGLMELGQIEKDITAAQNEFGSGDGTLPKDE